MADTQSIHGFPKWVFPKIVVPQNGWFMMENPIKSGCFGGTPISGNIQMGADPNLLY